MAPDGALSEAAAKGYLDVVRLLLDAGVDADGTVEDETSERYLSALGRAAPSPLVGAILKEHTAMFNLLIELGADLHSGKTAEKCFRLAKTDGLESMLLLLKAHGVDFE